MAAQPALSQSSPIVCKCIADTKSSVRECCAGKSADVHRQCQHATRRSTCIMHHMHLLYQYATSYAVSHAVSTRNMQHACTSLAGDKAPSAMGNIRPRTPTKAALTARAHALRSKHTSQHHQELMGGTALPASAVINAPASRSLPASNPQVCK